MKLHHVVLPFFMSLVAADVTDDEDALRNFTIKAQDVNNTEANRILDHLNEIVVEAAKRDGIEGDVTVSNLKAIKHESFIKDNGNAVVFLSLHQRLAIDLWIKTCGPEKWWDVLNPNDLQTVTDAFDWALEMGKTNSNRDLTSGDYQLLVDSVYKLWEAQEAARGYPEMDPPVDMVVHWPPPIPCESGKVSTAVAEPTTTAESTTEPSTTENASETTTDEASATKESTATDSPSTDDASATREDTTTDSPSSTDDASTTESESNASATESGSGSSDMATSSEETAETASRSDKTVKSTETVTSVASTETVDCADATTPCTDGTNADTTTLVQLTLTKTLHCGGTSATTPCVMVTTMSDSEENPEHTPNASGVALPKEAPSSSSENDSTGPGENSGEGSPSKGDSAGTEGSNCNGNAGSSDKESSTPQEGAPGSSDKTPPISISFDSSKPESSRPVESPGFAFPSLAVSGEDSPAQANGATALFFGAAAMLPFVAALF
ncbi:hypothetical protein CJU90_6600 [Yarrowia sp. C11]|nr:hypothetical protein CJU90_6600 [Yarrowia sp. C11]KAG5358712.1 hypothetical protein CKK34_4977 [Yarrowia sp. E02]